MGPTAVYVHIASSDLHSGGESKRWHQRSIAFSLQTLKRRIKDVSFDGN